jgi:hypothetical protein
MPGARPSGRVAVGGLALIALSLAAAARPGAPLAASAPNPSTRFSDLAEITPATVSRLSRSGRSTSVSSPGSPASRPSRRPDRPVLAGRSSSSRRPPAVIAIDAETAPSAGVRSFAGLTRACEQPNRGASLWEERMAGQAVARTIFPAPVTDGSSRRRQ